MEALGRMAGGIAHDFNNYLAIILGNTEYLMEEISTGGPWYEAVKDMKNASLNAREVVRQILLFSQMDLEEQTQEYLKIDTFIQEQLPLIKAIVPRSILLEYDYHSRNDCNVVVVRSQMQRIFFNLIINAVHAIGDRSGHPVAGPVRKNHPIEVSVYSDSPAGGCISIAVTTTTFTEKSDVNNIYDSIAPGKYVTVIIRDNGCGIPPGNMEKIFDPYFTTKATGQGFGIGLSVVHGIVKSLKGTIHVQSIVNKGSTFSVFFPAAGIRKGV